MRKSNLVIAAGVVFAAVQFAAGAAFATSVAIGGYTQSPSGRVVEHQDTRFKVRKADGELVDSGKTKRTEKPEDGQKDSDVPSKGKIELKPGRYIIEVWYTDGHGKKYKGTKKITVHKRKNLTVFVQVEPESKLDVLYDEFDTYFDQRETLWMLHDRATKIGDKAAQERYRARLDEQFKTGTAIQKKIDTEKSRLAGEKPKTGTKQAEKDKSGTTKDNKSKTGTQKADAKTSGTTQKENTTTPDAGLPGKPKISDYGKALEERNARTNRKTKAADKTGAGTRQSGRKLTVDVDKCFDCDMGTPKPLEDHAHNHVWDPDKCFDCDMNPDKPMDEHRPMTPASKSVEKNRAALEEKQSSLQQERSTQTTQLASFVPEFLRRRAALLAELPAATRTHLENNGGTDPAGYAAVKYTRLKIQIEVMAAANEGTKVPNALVKLANLYNRMGGYYVAVQNTDVQVAKTQKDIAHTVVDERAYAMGGEGGEGGGGGGGGGDGGGN